MLASDLFFLVGTAVVLLALERLMPLHGEQRFRRDWRTDLAHLVFSGAVIRIGGVVVVLGLSVMSLSVVPEPVRQAVRAQPGWLQFLEILVLSDLFFYLAHRISHASPVLWRFHAVHHSSERLDWLATYRVHPVDQIFNSALIALPAIVLGFSPLPLLAYHLVYRIHAPLLHSNVRLELGWLGRVVATPRFHHWHHADHAEAYDRNFAGQLSIIDRLFGSEHRPGRDTLPTRYGVSDPLPAGWLGQMLQPFGLWRPSRRHTAEAAVTTPAE